MRRARILPRREPDKKSRVREQPWLNPGVRLTLSSRLLSREQATLRLNWSAVPAVADYFQQGHRGPTLTQSGHVQSMGSGVDQHVGDENPDRAVILFRFRWIEVVGFSPSKSPLPRRHHFGMAKVDSNSSPGGAARASDLRFRTAASG